VATALLLDMSGPRARRCLIPTRPSRRFEDDDDPFSFGLRDGAPASPSGGLLDMPRTRWR